MKKPFVYYASEKEQLRDISSLLGEVIDGRLNSSGEVTLQAGTSVTTVMNERTSENSVILFCPITANASSALPSLWISDRTNKISFSVTHENSASADKTFGYVIFTP